MEQGVHGGERHRQPHLGGHVDGNGLATLWRDGVETGATWTVRTSADTARIGVWTSGTAADSASAVVSSLEISDYRAGSAFTSLTGWTQTLGGGSVSNSPAGSVTLTNAGAPARESRKP